MSEDIERFIVNATTPYQRAIAGEIVRLREQLREERARAARLTRELEEERDAALSVIAWMCEDPRTLPRREDP